MGLRTASVRRPRAAVMAPALTETNQTQGFEHTASPINGKAAGKGFSDAFDNLNTLALATELIEADPPSKHAMSVQKPPLAEHDVDLFDADVPANVDDIMQVITSMEGSADRLPIFGLDKDLFNDVDVIGMNMNMEDTREARTKELLAEVSRVQLKLERRLSFLLRRARKFQIRNMGQHAAAEIAGVFEHVHRTVRRCKAKSDEAKPSFKKSDEIKPKFEELYRSVKKPGVCSGPSRKPSELYGSIKLSEELHTPATAIKSEPKEFCSSSKKPAPLLSNKTERVSALEVLFSSTNQTEGSYSSTKTSEELYSSTKAQAGRCTPMRAPDGRYSSTKATEDLYKASDARYTKPPEGLCSSTKPSEGLYGSMKPSAKTSEQLYSCTKTPDTRYTSTKSSERLYKSSEARYSSTKSEELHTSTKATEGRYSLTKPTEGLYPTTITQENSKPIPHGSMKKFDDQEQLKPISYNSTKNLCKKLELTTAMQASHAARQRHAGKYFGSGSAETAQLRAGLAVLGATPIPQWSPEDKKELQKVAGFLASEMRLVQDDLDSEATVSSSGGESCDEMQNYNNPHQQYLPIHKRAAWKYATERAAIACRWTWLQAQVSDLEYRIRQHSDLHRKIRSSKERVCLGGASPPRVPASVPTSPSCVNGYRGQLPGASPSAKTNENGTPSNGTCPDVQCARTRPLINFRKRKLLQFNGLHAVSKKAARPSSIRCGCVPPDTSCALCTGRTDPTHPRDISDYLSKDEKLGLLDPSYHPVFSLTEDASSMLHMEAIMKTPEWQQRSSRANLKSIKFTKADRMEKANAGGPLDHRPRKSEHRKKYNRLKPSTANALTAKIKNRFRGRKGVRPSSSLDGADEEVESLGISSGGGKFDSPSSSPLLPAQAAAAGYPRRNRADSYDIDNIIIPYSVAASTRVEKLQYKEILTPKWRIAEHEFVAKYDPKNNGIVKASQEFNEDEEDLSEEATVVRHEKCEQDEKKKFLSYLKLPIGYGRSRSSRRTDSRAESSGANTPDPMSPAPPLHNPAENPTESGSPMTTPPPTPAPPEDAALRRRTVSQSRHAKDKDAAREEGRNTPEAVDVQPYEKRVFPLTEETYDRMLRSMPDDHKLKTNARSQDSSGPASPPSDTEEKADFHDSESTESAFGDEDPNDPEWDVDRVKDHRYRR